MIVDIPSGWKSKNIDDNSFMLMTHDEKKIVVIIWGNFSGKSLEEIAKEFSKVMHGTKPRYDTKFNAYRFLYMIDETWEAIST